MLAKYTLSWLGMVLIAIANGAFREKAYGLKMSALAAHQLSTVTAIALFGVYIWCLTAWWPLMSTGQATAVGGIWLSMTVAFEFVFGHFVMGHSWQRLFEDYNILRGRVWSLVLVWIAVAPLLFYIVRARPR